MTDSSIPPPRVTPIVEVDGSVDTPPDTAQGSLRSRADVKAVHPSTRPRPPQRSRVSIALLRDLRDRLAKYCAAEGTTESAIVSAALDQYLESSSDKELLMRRLDRLDQAIGQVRCMLDLASETFAAYLRTWFAHTPSVQPDGRRAALTISEARYLQVVEYVAARMARGQRFAQDVASARSADGDGPAGDTRNGPSQLGEKNPGTGNDAG